MASTGDIKIASLAAGFTIGFGFLTVWEAMKQTRRNRHPLRSAYIYMLWGEIIANLSIAIIGWVFLDGLLQPSVTVLFFILFLWVFEVQLLMQIIINRIGIIAEHRKTIRDLKIGTAVIITCINIAVFCIWIPSHTVPPASELFVQINKYWDRLSKVLILLVDAGLNWYFLRIVKHRLLDQHHLTKYAPLVGFNTKLMVLSIAMDAMLIGLMSLPNQVVYIQFHPVAYMVKLNIEMSMASLITRLARGENSDDFGTSVTTSHHRTTENRVSTARHAWSDNHGLQPVYRTNVVRGDSSEDLSELGQGIHKRMDVVVETVPNNAHGGKGESRRAKDYKEIEDELPLRYNAGHPEGNDGTGPNVSQERST